MKTLDEILVTVRELAESTETPVGEVIESLKGVCWDEEVGGWLKENA